MRLCNVHLCIYIFMHSVTNRWFFAKPFHLCLSFVLGNFKYPIKTQMHAFFNTKRKKLGPNKWILGIEHYHDKYKMKIASQIEALSSSMHDTNYANFMFKCAVLCWFDLWMRLGSLLGIRKYWIYIFLADCLPEHSKLLTMHFELK